MAQKDLIASIDQALAALKAARKALKVDTKPELGSKSVTTTKTRGDKPAPVRKGMSVEGRQRIAEAQRKRWAVMKRAAKKAARAAGK